VSRYESWSTCRDPDRVVAPWRPWREVVLQTELGLQLLRDGGIIRLAM